ncbi:hypothetical protein [Luteimonas suaedae]|uniref:hypothetical protein n=1 Tax=Luteimonas suaedae TaxID=2605430 RepID=UPI0011EC64F9|nr:hypothetical protein [Luteimonas suaedae]
MSITPSIYMLYSTFTPPPSTGFHGYCFVDSDYIFGAEGAAQYAAATGRVIGPGEDGCYISIERTSETVEFGADAAGTAKLFYYDKAGVWAVSNSLARLVDHLRENGVRLAPNLPQLDALSWGITFTKQVSSFATIFNEIRLLPSDRRLVLTPCGLREKARPEPSLLPYPDALRSFIDTWTSRFATLFLDDRIRITLDLTGGVDSRAIFALAKTGLARADVSPSRAIFRSATTPRWKKDLKIATSLAERYGIAVNPQEQAAQTKLSGEERYTRWREVCLGVYLPIYLHDSTVDPFTIHINGGGGENHRHFYPAVPASRFLRDQRKRAPAYLYNEWLNDTEEALAYLADQNDTTEPLILHYREFRNRFHTGRPPLYRTGFAPLTTTLFHRSAMLGGITHAGQLNFDIMENLIPGLKDFRYDDPSKAPTDETLKNLTIVDLDQNATAGQTYIGDTTAPQQQDRGRGDRKPMELIALEGTKALKKEAVVSFVDDSVLTQAQAVLESAVSAGNFEHATLAKGVSFVLAAELALGD